MGALWPSGLERWIGDRVVLCSNPAAATSLRNFVNSVYPALSVSFVGDPKSRWSLLSAVYVNGSKISHQSALEMCNLSWTPPLLEKDNSKNNPLYKFEYSQYIHHFPFVVALRGAVVPRVQGTTHLLHG